MILLTNEEIGKLPKFVTSKITTRPEVVAKAQLKKDLEASLVMRGVLEKLLKHYLSLANSGDAGFWDPEGEEEVINARQALLEEARDV